MKNTTKLIALSLLIGASCASLYSMEENPNKRKRTQEPASPEASKQNTTPPAQTPAYVADKKRKTFEQRYKILGVLSNPAAEPHRQEKKHAAAKSQRGQHVTLPNIVPRNLFAEFTATENDHDQQ